MPYAGEIAALTTALCWTFTSVFFTEAGHVIGAFRVNNIRLVFAVVIYAAVLLITTGQVWPENMNNQQFAVLAISGLIGLVIGDGFGFRAFVLIGPRITTLLWSTAPIMVTLIAWFFLDEALRPVDLVGIALTLGGITWVVAERQYGNSNGGRAAPDSKTLVKGIVFATLASLGQGVGLVLSKQGMLYMGTTIDPMPASFVRMFSAMILIWILAAVRGQFGNTMRAFGNGKAMLFSAGGSLFGPFMGVWMSMIAVARIEAGIAATLNSLTPVLIIPLVRIYYKEKISLRSLFGAIIAVAGVALLLVGDKVVEMF